MIKIALLILSILFIFPAVSFSKWVSPEPENEVSGIKIVEEESADETHRYERDVFSGKKPIVYDGKPDYWRMAQKHNEAIRNRKQK